MSRLDVRIDPRFRLDPLMAARPSTSSLFPGTLAFPVEVATWAGRLEHQRKIGGRRSGLDAAPRCKRTHLFVGVSRISSSGTARPPSNTHLRNQIMKSRPAFMS